MTVIPLSSPRKRSDYNPNLTEWIYKHELYTHREGSENLNADNIWLNWLYAEE